MTTVSECKNPVCTKLEKEKCKAVFTANGKDISAFVAAFGISAMVVSTEFMEHWAAVGAEKYANDPINPAWTLQQHVHTEQMTAILGFFALFYLLLCGVSACLRFLVYDSGTPEMLGKISRLVLSFGYSSCHNIVQKALYRLRRK